MEILRAKTLDLKTGTRPLTPRQAANVALNEKEALAGVTRPRSRPRRLVFEMTNACNLRCRMCAREAADFKPTVFDPAWRGSFEPILPEVEEATLVGWGSPPSTPSSPTFWPGPTDAASVNTSAPTA